MLNSARMLMNLSSNIKGGIVKASGGVNQKVSINAVACEISLTETLRNMQTDYIDFFLLHECSMEEAHREDMLSFLASAVKAGKIRHIGLATNFTNLPRNLSILDPIYEVVQYNDDRISNHTSQLIGCENKLLIHFNIISSSIKSNGKIPVNELLSWSKTNNPNGICLFTSTKKANIQTNVKCWCN